MQALENLKSIEVFDSEEDALLFFEDVLLRLTGFGSALFRHGRGHIAVPGEPETHRGD